MSNTSHEIELVIYGTYSASQMKKKSSEQLIFPVLVAAVSLVSVLHIDKMTFGRKHILQSSASTGGIFRVCCGVLLMLFSCTMKPDNQPENPLVVGDAVLDIDTVWNTAILSFRFDTVRTKASHLNSYRQAVCGGFIRRSTEVNFTM